MSMHEAAINNEQERLNTIEFDNDTLVELSLFEKSRMKNVQIALVTDNSDLQKLNYYLFRDVKDVDYFTIETELKEEDLYLLEEMDIIIYSREDNALKEEILHNIKAKNLSTKFFCITNKPYLRQKDILQEHINGVDKLMKMDFFLEDYILSMEKYLYNNFYSKRLLKLEENQDIILKSHDTFRKRVEDLLSRKIFFSILQYNYESEIDINEYNLRKIVREYDTILIDEDKREISFLLLNIIPEFAQDTIKKRIGNFSIMLTLKEAKSAFDLVYNIPKDK